MADETPPHFGPRPQNDAQAANSAAPDTDRPALWDDPDHERYVLATDPSYYYSFMHPEEAPQPGDPDYETFWYELNGDDDDE